MAFVDFQYGKKEVISGSDAAAIGAKLARVRVVPVYPITPQTIVCERLAEFINNGKMDAKMIHVESEHSACSAVIGSVSAGARTYSATDSQGLALMNEILFVVSGLRLPVVFGIANRALSAPINIWCDQQDSISARDSGWIQLYCENCQEILDTTLMAYKISEDEKVHLPIMVCFDGFVLSHVYEPVDIPSQEMADKFLPEFKIKNILDVNNPISIGTLGAPDSYMEFRKQQDTAMKSALKVIPLVSKEFKLQFGRDYGNGLVETYWMNDAETAVLALGSTAATARDVIDKMRKAGKKVGLIKLKSLRPLPEKELCNICKNLKSIAVIDRDISVGNEGAVFSEIKSALYNAGIKIKATNFIMGLGGRDIRPIDIEYAIENSGNGGVIWVNVNGK